MNRFFRARRARLAVLLLVAILPTTSWAYQREAASQLTSVVVEQPPLGDLSKLLHVKKVSGTLQFAAPIEKAKLVLEIYSGGEKLPQSTDLDLQNHFTDRGTTVRFALQAADLDYLTLGDSRKGYCRLFVEVGIFNPTTSSMVMRELGIPKGIFDVSQAAGFVPLNWKDAKGGKTPVFCLVQGENLQLSSALETVIERNPTARLLIGYLEFE